VLPDWVTAVEAWVPVLAESPWACPVLALLAALDGFLPPVPSETLVIALASLSVAQGSPHLALVVLAAALGAFAGDQAAYWVGSRVDVHRARLFRTARAARALRWAEQALAHRGASFVLAARYVPVGRVAVNMAAGALGFPRRRFVPLSALGAVTWSGYGTALGVGAGAWLEGSPLLAVAVGVGAGAVLGLVVDRVLRRWTRPAALAAAPGGVG